MVKHKRFIRASLEMAVSGGPTYHLQVDVAASGPILRPLVRTG